jgi:hypothetical protein
VKGAAGKVLGDKKLQSEGKADKVKGKVQNAFGGDLCPFRPPMSESRQVNVAGHFAGPRILKGDLTLGRALAPHRKRTGWLWL